MDFNAIWRNTPPGVIDFLLRRDMIRHAALKRGKEKLYENMVVVNEENRPRGVQQSRCLLLQNLLDAVNRALSDGRISPQVSRSIIGNFVGKTILTEKERTQPFTDTHGIQPPNFLAISPTKKCNLACKGCYAASSAGNKETLKYDVFDRIIKEKKETWGSHFTVISGGEPLLYNDEGKTMFDIFESNRDTYFMMYTNSTLINKETAKRMAEAGNVTPAISVEGFEKETDERRGKGVYKRIMQAMENLRSVGVPFGVSITVTRNNADLVMSDEFMKYYFHDQGAIYGWVFQYMPIGRSFAVDLMITPQQRLDMFKKEQQVIKDQNLFLVDFWNGGPYAHGCISAGRTGGYFYIDWNGNVSPCVFFPYYLANIYDVYKENKTLNDILFSPYFSSIREWQNSYGYTQPPDKVDNLIAPCLLRDHYDVAHDIISKFSAVPSDPDAASAINDEKYRDRMIHYGQEVKSLTQEWWETEFMSDNDKRLPNA